MAQLSEPETILAVDDELASRFAITQLLRTAGFSTLEASTGREALALAPRAALVVLDIHLPDLSGLEVARRLKESAATRDVPVLHLSATCTSPEERARGLGGGADAYLTQPFDNEELIATVRALLRLARQRRDARMGQAAEGRAKPALRTDFATERLTRVARLVYRLDAVVYRVGEPPADRFVLARRRDPHDRVDLGATFEDAAVALERLLRATSEE